MMPPVETAAKMPFRPAGLKPLAAVRLLVSKLEIASTRIVSSGTAIFHQVAALLVAASFLTPRKLIDVNSAIRMIETTMPVALSTPVAALSHANQPNDAPATPPKA